MDERETFDMQVFRNLKKAKLFNRVTQGLKAIKNDLSTRRRILNYGKIWRVQRDVKPSQASHGRLRLLLVPSDFDNVAGSIGDDAMITVVLGQFRARHPDIEVGIVTSSLRGERVAATFSATPMTAVGRANNLNSIKSSIQSFNPSHCILIGADIMDGYYDSAGVCQRLAIAEIAVRLGAHASVVGFSFNDKPAPRLLPIYRQLSPKIVMNLRDEVSRVRFEHWTGKAGTLVADCAFLLEPEHEHPSVANATRWVEAELEQGKQVIGLNINPHLFSHLTPAQIALKMKDVAKTLHSVSQCRPISFLLIPHDFRREGEGDMTCLGPIREKLEQLGVSCFVSEAKKAIHIKAITGSLSGVISGRMHLLIATMGMGTPAAAFTYQDKFEGLFNHFALPGSLLLPPENMFSHEQLSAFLIAFIDNLEEYKTKVQRNKPSVMAYAQRNFQEVLQ